MATITLNLPRPHAGQQRILAEKRRWNIVNCGRRWGKTVFSLDRIARPALAGQPVAYFIPSYPMLAEVWRAAKQLLGPVLARVDSQGKRLELITGGVVDFWSLTNADSIRGRRYQRAVIDEAAMVRNLKDAWEQVIRPTLTDFKGDAYFLSTPRGRNFFYELFQRGIGGEPDYVAFQMPTVSNPFIDPAEIAAARKELPELIFAQEYLATFLDDQNGLFRKVFAAATAEVQEGRVPGHSYVIGVDWARSGDYTVLSVVDTTTMEQVYLDRFNQVDYEVQKDRLFALNERFQPDVILAEANNMGGPLIESLRGRLPIQPFVTTNSTKKEIIDGLALAFEQGSFRILNDAMQIGELLAFEQTRLPSGLFRYAAAGNGHDDCVIALALATYAAQRPGAAGLVSFV